MIEKIMKIVYDYTKNVKLLDEKAIEKIVDIVVQERELGPYISDLEFPYDIKKEGRSLTVADYNPITKQMNIYIEAFDMYSESQKKYDILFEGFELVLFQNVMMLRFILHELEHAFEYKQVDTLEDGGIELELLKASSHITRRLFDLRNAERDDLDLTALLNLAFVQIDQYNKFYRFQPMERIAETRAYEAIIEMLKRMKVDLFNLDEFMKASLLEFQLKAYTYKKGFVQNPTELYLYGTGQSDIWRNFNFYDPNIARLVDKVREEYCLKDRLTYGLPITGDEYKESRLRFRRSNKYRTK